MDTATILLDTWYHRWYQVSICALVMYLLPVDIVSRLPSLPPE